MGKRKFQPKPSRENSPLFASAEQLLLNTKDSITPDGIEIVEQQIPYDQAPLLQSIEVQLNALQDAIELERTVSRSAAPTGIVTGSFSQKFASALYKMEYLLDEMCYNHYTARRELAERLSRPGEEWETAVDLNYNAERIFLRMPYLPSRNCKTETVGHAMLYAKLQNAQDLPRWDRWNADFVHVYPSRGNCVPKDADNYDYKMAIDILAYTMRMHDCAGKFSFSAAILHTDDIPSGTYIRVTPKNTENWVFTAFSEKNKKKRKTNFYAHNF